MGIWEQLGRSSCGDTLPTPFLQPLPPSHLLFRDGDEGGHRAVMGLTGDVDLDRDFCPAHLVLRPACHILSIEVTGNVGQGQPQRCQIPRLLCQEKEGEIKKSIRWLLARGWGLEQMSSGTPSGSRWEREGPGREGEERGMGGNLAENGPPPLELDQTLSWIIYFKMIWKM